MAAGADLVQRVALPHGDDPVEVAERARPCEDLDAGDRLDRQRALVDQHDVLALLGGGGSGPAPGAPATDDEHVGVAAAVLGPPLAVGLLLAQNAEAGGVP